MKASRAPRAEGGYHPAMPLDLVQLVRQQIARDRERTRHRPFLFDRKRERMSASPFAFLRGAAPFFYELLRGNPWLAAGPPGEGWITGDLHLENFGAFRATSAPPGKGKPAEGAEVVFDINDFDEAVRGPWRLDLLRVTTSALLAARQAGAAAGADLDCARGLLQAYTEALRKGIAPGKPPKLIAGVIERAKDLKSADQIREITRRDGDGLAFIPSEEFMPASQERPEVEQAFSAYAAGVAAGDPGYHERLAVLDVAIRVAGTGSLGTERFGILTRGKESGWLFDMKEQGEPAAAILLGPSNLDPAQRVLDATRQSIASPTRMLGTATFRGRSMLVRRLSAQESKLRLSAKTFDHHDELLPVVEHLARCIAAAHRRSATVDGCASWDDEAQAGLLERAAAVAGLHEAAWLAYLRLA